MRLELSSCGTPKQKFDNDDSSMLFITNDMPGWIDDGILKYMRGRVISSRKIDRCPCCDRMAKLTFHHLIPKQMHRRKYFRKTYSKETLNNGVMICRMCHDGIHKFYPPMVLAKRLNTLEQLRQDQQLKNYFHWVSKQRIVVA